jgi:hypothetical protein
MVGNVNRLVLQLQGYQRVKLAACEAKLAAFKVFGGSGTKDTRSSGFALR